MEEQRYIVVWWRGIPYWEVFVTKEAATTHIMNLIRDGAQRRKIQLFEGAEVDWVKLL